MVAVARARALFSSVLLNMSLKAKWLVRLHKAPNQEGKGRRQLPLCHGEVRADQAGDLSRSVADPQAGYMDFQE